MRRPLAAILLGLTVILLLLSFHGLARPLPGRWPRRRSPEEGGPPPEPETPDLQPPANEEQSPPGAPDALPVTAPGDGPPEPRTPRGRRLVQPRTLLLWVLYLAFIAGAIVGTPQALGWALDTPNPMAAVSGSSMWPTLTRGDLVFLQGVDSIGDLNEEDIIAFRQERGFAIHRIVRIDGDVITTRGDGNLVDDPSITIDDVIGKIPKVAGRLTRLPFLGNLSLALGPLVRKDVDYQPEDRFSKPVEDLSGQQPSGRSLGEVEDISDWKRESLRSKWPEGKSWEVRDLRAQ